VVYTAEPQGSPAGTSSIFGQLFNPLGEMIGTAFQISPPHSSNYVSDANPAVVANGNDFFVAYESEAEFGPAIRGTEVRFDETGAPSVQATTVFATPSLFAPVENPTVSVAEEGDGYTVGWAQTTQSGGQRVSVNTISIEDGTVSGPALAINTTTGASDEADNKTASATFSDGTQIIVGNGATSDMALMDSIVFRLLDAGGALIGAARSINETVYNDRTDDQVTIAVHDNDSWVIAWRSTDDLGDTEIQFQRFTTEGVPDGSIQVLAPAQVGGTQSEPVIQALKDGGFLIAWVEQLAGADSHVWISRFDADGQMAGGAVLVATEPGEFTNLGMKVFPDGRAVMTSDVIKGASSKTVVHTLDTALLTIVGNNNLDDVLVALEEASIVHGDALLTGATLAGNDTLYAVGQGDTLIGGHGDDLLYSGEGADLLRGGEGNDTVSYKHSHGGVTVSLSNLGEQGGNGYGADDVFRDIEALIGSDWDDRLDGNALGNLLVGGEGYDLLVGWDGNDTLRGGAGNDTIFAGEGNDVLFGEDGEDELDGSYGNDKIYGGKGKDELYGGHNSDSLFGGDGHDLIDGEHGADSLSGVQGADSLFGGNGADSLFGGDGNDTLLGEDANDLLYGGNGADSLHGGKGGDSLHGGNGADTVIGADGNDMLRGNAGADLIQGGKGGDSLFGGNQDDTLFGGAGNDVVRGEASSDVLNGGDGHDSLYGGAQADILRGDKGNDRLEGGDGADTFVFNIVAFGKDDIVDFADNVDALLFSSSVSGGLTAQQIINTHADDTSGSFTKIDFGGGNEIILEGITDKHSLVDDIAFI